MSGWLAAMFGHCGSGAPSADVVLGTEEVQRRIGSAEMTSGALQKKLDLADAKWRALNAEYQQTLRGNGRGGQIDRALARRQLESMRCIEGEQRSVRDYKKKIDATLYTVHQRSTAQLIAAQLSDLETVLRSTAPGTKGIERVDAIMASINEQIDDGEDVGSIIHESDMTDPIERNLNIKGEDVLNDALDARIEEDLGRMEAEDREAQLHAAPSPLMLPTPAAPPPPSLLFPSLPPPPAPAPASRSRIAEYMK